VAKSDEPHGSRVPNHRQIPTAGTFWSGAADAKSGGNDSSRSASHAELETQAIIANRRTYIDRGAMKEFDDLSASVGQLAHGLLRSLEPHENI